MTKNNGGIKKGDLQCRSCKKTFNHEDLIVKETERFGLIIKEKVCPHCGSRTYGLINYPIDESKLIYKNNYNLNENNSRNHKRILMEKYMLDDEQELEFYINGFQIQERHEIFIKEVNDERMAMA